MMWLLLPQCVSAFAGGSLVDERVVGLSTQSITMKHKDSSKPKRAISSPQMPATSYTRTKNSWRAQASSMTAPAAAAAEPGVPTLQAHRLPEPREGERIPVGRYPALVLNADYQPLSYVPLSLWSWQDTVRAVFRGSVTVLTTYEDVSIRSPSFEMEVYICAASASKLDAASELDAARTRAATASIATSPRKLLPHPRRSFLR